MCTANAPRLRCGTRSSWQMQSCGRGQERSWSRRGSKGSSETNWMGGKRWCPRDTADGARATVSVGCVCLAWQKNRRWERRGLSSRVHASSHGAWHARSSQRGKMPTGARAVARAVARTAVRVLVHAAAASESGCAMVQALAQALVHAAVHPAGAGGGTNTGRMALCPAEHVSTGTPAAGIAEGGLVSWRAPWS